MSFTLRFINPCRIRFPVSVSALTGQWFTRLETWAEQAQPWITYLARSSFLLQQGKYVADIVYFYGEDSNLTAIFAKKSPDVPAGYSFDYVNADALINALSVSNGLITTKTGMAYHMLALDPRSRHMSLAVLRKIRDMVRSGAVVVGSKPVESPSLADNQVEFQTIADEVWGTGTERPCFRKRQSLSRPEAGGCIAPDRAIARLRLYESQRDTKLLFLHRRLVEGDLYWVNNRNSRAKNVDVTLRVHGKAPEIWHPDTGKVEPASYRIEGGRTTVSLRMDPIDAVFIVFRKPAVRLSATVPAIIEKQVATVGGAWNVSFQQERGAPARITLDRLSSWSDSGDAGVKYFSGTGIYYKSIEAPADWFIKGARLWLDLGSVKNIAALTVNVKAWAFFGKLLSVPM